MRPEQHDSQQQGCIPTTRSNSLSLPREIISTLEFCSHPNYQSRMKKEFSCFQTCEASKTSPPAKPLDGHLEMQVFCSGKTNKLRMQMQTKNGLNPGKHEPKPILRMLQFRRVPTSQSVRSLRLYEHKRGK